MSHWTQDQALLAVCPYTVTCTLGLSPRPLHSHLAPSCVTWDSCHSAEHAWVITFWWLSDLAMGTGGYDASEDGTTDLQCIALSTDDSIVQILIA